MITLGLDKEGGSMSVANALANDTRVLYGATRSLLPESVCRSGLSFSVIGKKDKNTNVFFWKKFTGSK